MGKYNDKISLLESQGKDTWTSNSRTTANILSHAPARLIPATLALYEILKFDATYQQTNKPKLAQVFLAKQLHMRKEKIEAAKQILFDLGLIREKKVPTVYVNGNETPNSSN
jgi:hypothetical protein